MFPALLARTLRTADVRHEVEPIVGYVASLVAGMVILCLSFWIVVAVDAAPPGGLAFGPAAGAVDDR